METISSGLRAAGSALYSGGTAVSSAVTSAGSWLGRQVSWVPSSTKSAASTARSSSTNSIFLSIRKYFASSSLDRTSTDSAISAKVESETALPQASFKEFACYEAAARALAEHLSSDLPQKPKTNFMLALAHFNLCTNPSTLKADKALSRNRAVAYMKEAISKFPPEDQTSIGQTLQDLETEYDRLQNSMPLEVETGVNERGEIVTRPVPSDRQETFPNTKAILLKKAQAALAPQAEEAPVVDQSRSKPLTKAQQKKLKQCQDLKAKLDRLDADTKLASYESHFAIAQKYLKQAEDFYRAGNFNPGDQQYAYAHRFADTPRYMELREKLNITRVASEIGSQDQYDIGNETLNRKEMDTRVEENPNNTALQNYWKAVSKLEAAGKADSVEKYEASLKAVEEYLHPLKAMLRYQTWHRIFS